MINIKKIGVSKADVIRKIYTGGGFTSSDGGTTTVNAASYGGTVYIEKYNKNNFYNALTSALNNNNNFTVFDCTYFTGDITISDTIVIDKPCRILLGNASYTCYGKNFFEIRSNNVQILGYNRETDRTVDYKNSTKLYLTDNAISNESVEGYHIYSKGNKNLRFENLALYGKRTTLGRQCHNAQYPIDGYGGIYIEKENPVETYGGNTCNNTIIDQLLIDGTKAHGIYINTGILCKLSNIRCSQIAGHGIFLNGGTSITLDNCYMASTQCAGFCLLGITYCALINCVSEYCGTAFLTRGSFNVSMFSPGCEQTMNQGNNPWGNSSTVTGVNGFNVIASGFAQDSNGEYTIPTSQRINDVSSDLGGVFNGTPFTIVGGRGISLYTPYCIGICQRRGNAGDTMWNKNTTALLRIIGNARKITVTNAQGQQMNGANEIYNDIKIESNAEGSPNGVDIVYDPTQPLITSPFNDYVTDKAATYAPVYCVPSAQNVSIRNGSTYYYKTKFVQNIETNEIDTELVNADLIDMGYVRISKADNSISIIENSDYEVVTDSPVTLGSIGTNTGEVNDNENYCHTEMIDFKDNMYFTITPIGDDRGYTTLLYIYDKESDGNYTFTRQTVDLGRTNVTKDNVIINQNLSEGKAFRLRFYTNYQNVKFTIIEKRSDLHEKVKINKDGIFINGVSVVGGEVVDASTVEKWGFTKNKGTVTSVTLNGKNVQPNSSGVVDLGTIESGGGSTGGGSNVTKLSELENDCNFITKSDIPTDISAFNNDKGYVTSLDLTKFISEKNMTLKGYTFEDLAKLNLYANRTGEDCYHTIMLMKSSKYYYMWFDYNQTTTMNRRIIQCSIDTSGTTPVITHVKNFKVELFTDTNLE